MKLYEYEGKDLFEKYGVPVPRRVLIESVEDVDRAIEIVGLPAVVKAQVLVGGRGRAGGIKVAKSVDEAKHVVEEIRSRGVRGVRPRKFLLEEFVDIERELYLSITVDRSARKYIVLASSEGGIEIEEIARERPETIVKVFIDPLEGLQPHHVRYVERGLVSRGIDGSTARMVAELVPKLFRLMMDLDAELVEINPLAKTRDGRVLALDSKIIIDDNALYRHPDLAKVLEEDPRDFTPLEIVARRYGFSFVELDGDVAVIANGAGLTMATMDMVAEFGGKPACFLDIGGGANRDRVREALKIVLTLPRVKTVIVNIFGGITRCDEVARGVVEALQSVSSTKPIVVRMVGTNEEEGRRILESVGIQVFSDDLEAVKKAVELARGGG